MSTISTMHGLVLLRDGGEGVGAEGRETVQALARDGAHGVRGLLLEELELELAAGSLDNFLLVRLGGIAMLSAVGESLNHCAKFPSKYKKGVKICGKKVGEVRQCDDVVCSRGARGHELDVI